MPNPPATPQAPTPPNIYWNTLPDGSQAGFVHNGKKWEQKYLVPAQPQGQQNPAQGNPGYGLQYAATTQQVQPQGWIQQQQIPGVYPAGYQLPPAPPTKTNWLKWIGLGCLGLTIVSIILVLIGLFMIANLPKVAGTIFSNWDLGREEIVIEPDFPGGFSTVCTNDAVYAPGWDQFGRTFRANGESDGDFEYVYRLHEGGVNVGDPILTRVLPKGIDIIAWKMYPGCGWGQLPEIG
jgi:hypothetical protein